MTSQIRLLVDMINKNVSLLEELCKSDGTNIPDLHTAFHPSSEAFRINPDAAEACNVTIAAAHQLAAILTSPTHSLFNIIGGSYKSAALRVCLESNVTEILREAGPQGLHIDDIAKLNGQSPHKLGQFMRLLAVHHIYREVTPDVFVNTRISSLLDTFKSSKEVISDPEHKYENTNGIAALASHSLDEPAKSAAYAWEAYSDPEIARSGEPNETAFAKAIGAKETVWAYHNRPEQQFRQTRFGIGMRAVAALQPDDIVLKAYDWQSLPASSLVVDVGGGIGGATHTVAKNFPHIRFVIQDLPAVIDDGKKWWAANLPDALESGRVTLQAHDFFAPQPQGATIFMLRQILHDWSDEYCLKILKQLRDTATPQTKLLMIQSIAQYTCHDSSVDENKIPGAVPKEAPEPLLANYGAANGTSYLADVGMCLAFNGQERTIPHLDRLLRSAGWKLSLVNRQPGASAFTHSMIAVPL